MAFSFMKLISSSDTSTKREAAILKICPPVVITSAEVSSIYDIKNQSVRRNMHVYFPGPRVPYSPLFASLSLTGVFIP